METRAELPIVLFEDPTEWRAWLAKNHALPTGLWIKMAKKSSGITSITYAQALEEALCYGWIDSQKQAYDESYWLQKFTPRGPKSIWSKVNVIAVEKLMVEGKMEPSGLAAVELAKQNGKWDAAYDSAKTMQVPDDFAAALDANPKAKAFFATLDKTNVYAFCWRVQTVKKEETRRAKIEKFITMLARGEKLH